MKKQKKILSISLTISIIFVTIFCIFDSFLTVETRQDSAEALKINASSTGLLKDEDYGKKIDYSVTVGNNGNQITLDDWRVFGDDKENQEVKIITADVIKYDAIPQDAFDTGIDYLDSDYSIYFPKGGALFEQVLNNTALWEDLVREDLRERGVTAKGGPTDKEFVESWNSNPETKDIPLEEGEDYWGWISDVTGKKLYTPRENEMNYCSGYWIATCYPPDPYTQPGYNLFVVDWTYGALRNFSCTSGFHIFYGLRPVISIPYEVYQELTGTTSIEVTKKWNDSDPSQRPDAIKFVVSENGVVETNGSEEQDKTNEPQEGTSNTVNNVANVVNNVTSNTVNNVTNVVNNETSNTIDNVNNVVNEAEKNEALSTQTINKETITQNESSNTVDNVNNVVNEVEKNQVLSTQTMNKETITPNEPLNIVNNMANVVNTVVKNEEKSIPAVKEKLITQNETLNTVDNVNNVVNEVEKNEESSLPTINEEVITQNETSNTVNNVNNVVNEVEKNEELGVSTVNEEIITQNEPSNTVDNVNNVVNEVEKNQALSVATINEETNTQEETLTEVLVEEKSGRYVFTVEVDKSTNETKYTFYGLPKYNEKKELIQYVVTEEKAEEDTDNKLSSYKAEGGKVTIVKDENGKDKYIAQITNSRIIRNSSITKTGPEKLRVIDGKVNYKIDYTFEIDPKYKDENIQITIVDTLPYKISENERNIAGGIYNESDQTITWTGTYNTTKDYISWNDEINTGVILNEEKQVKVAMFTKEISFVYLGTTYDDNGNEVYSGITYNDEGKEIINTVKGTIKLSNNLTDEREASCTTIAEWKKDVIVNKEWKGDTEETRPDSIDVTLKQVIEDENGQTSIIEVEDETTKQRDDVKVPIKIMSNTTEEGKTEWTYTWKDLPRYDKDGKEINYTVDETAINYQKGEETVENQYYCEKAEILEDENGNKKEDTEITLTNNKYASLTVTKVDSRKENIKLPEAEFSLEKVIKNETTGNWISEWKEPMLGKTNTDGTFIFEGLKYGQYRLTETKAPENYMISEDGTQIIEIKADNVNAQITVRNEKQYKLPLLGGIGVDTVRNVEISTLIMILILITSGKKVIPARRKKIGKCIKPLRRKKQI